MQMRKYKARFQSVNHIFISHLHGDHFYGLPGFLASMHLLGRKNELTIYGPKELEEIINMIHKHSETYLNYPLNFVYTQNTSKQLIFEDEKVFMVIGIAASSDEHVGVLSNLADVIDNEENLAELLKTNDPDVIEKYLGEKQSS